MAELVVVSAYGIPGGAGHRSHYVPLLSQQRIGKGRFADIRLAHDGNARDGILTLNFFLYSRIRGELGYDLVQQVAGAAACGSRDAPGLSEAQGVEFVCAVYLVAGIHLVDSKDHGLAAATQHVGYLGVEVSDACSNLYEEEHQVALFDGDHHLLADLALEDVVAVGGEAAGVDH